jgi:hypothetical protein
MLIKNYERENERETNTRKLNAINSRARKNMSFVVKTKNRWPPKDGEAERVGERIEMRERRLTNTEAGKNSDERRVKRKNNHMF